MNGLNSLLGEEFISNYFFIVDFDYVRSVKTLVDFPKDKEIIGFASNDISWHISEALGAKNVLDKKSSLKDIVDYLTIKKDDALFHQKHSLTSREKELLKFLCEGVDYKDIAMKIGIDKKTVYAIRRNLMIKLGCKNRYVFHNIFFLKKK